MMRRLALLGLAALLAAGCDKDEDVDPPAELVDVKPAIQVDKLWSTRVGDAGEHLRLSLGWRSTTHLYSPAQGVCTTLARNGRTRWRAETTRVSGARARSGLGGARHQRCDFVALEAADGPSAGRRS